MLGYNPYTPLKEGAPTITVSERRYRCDLYPIIKLEEDGFNVGWDGNKGYCGDCGQNYLLTEGVETIIS